MISKIRASKATFRTVALRGDFNIVLADRTEKSTQKDSRNGLGKTTLLNVIHFCLGAGVKKDKGLLKPILHGWEFSLDLVIDGRAFSVTRDTAEPGKVVFGGDTAGFPIKPRPDSLLHGPFLKIDDWTKVLGHLMFGLSVDEPIAHQPTFRDLFTYVVRVGKDGYSSPFETHRKQGVYLARINTAFLLGLSWQTAVEWKIHKEQEDLLNKLKKAAGAGLLTNVLGSEGKLEAERVKLQMRLKEEESGLKTFKVHPQYEEVERRANELTTALQKLTDANFAETRLLENYNESIKVEIDPGETEIRTAYELASVELPEVALKRFDEVREFHRSVIEDRRAFLSSEITRLKGAIADRTAQMRRLSDERAAIMGVLQSHGALDEYMKLQQLHVATVTLLKDVEQRLENIRRFTEGRDSLKMDEARLQQLTRLSISEVRAQRDRILATFAENTQFLYGQPGSFIIESRDNGFFFGWEMPRKDAAGVENMAIFCFDLMMAELWSDRDHSPGLLVHDSTIFEGVDERQKGLALELAASKSARFGFQYICTMNSDEVPTEQLQDDFLEGHVAQRLTDLEPSGRLLGIAYD